MAGVKSGWGRERRSLADIQDLDSHFHKTNHLLTSNAKVAEEFFYKRELCARWWYFMMIAAGSWKCYFAFAIFYGCRLTLGLWRLKHADHSRVPMTKPSLSCACLKKETLTFSPRAKGKRWQFEVKKHQNPLSVNSAKFSFSRYIT